MQWLSRLPTPWLLPVGRAAPAFGLPDAQGRHWSWQDLLRGRALLLDFFFVACEPCLDGLQLLQSLHRQHGAAGLVVAAISRGDSAQALQRCAADWGLDMPLLMATEDDPVLRDYRVLVHPSTYLVDRSGRIVHRHCGNAAAALRAALAKQGFMA